jgi:hypothetical protein
MSSLSATAPWRRLVVGLAALLAACAAPIERSTPMATPSRAPTRTESVPPLDARDHPTLETATFALG